MPLWPPAYSPEDVAKTYKPGGDAISVMPDDLMKWQRQIQDAFELGFKAAGGSIAPDVVGGGPWKIVEITMDRDEIDAVGRVVEAAIKRAGDVRTHAALTSFLDKISIFRRK